VKGTVIIKCLTQEQDRVSYKPRKLFGPVKAILVHLYIKTERSICLKLLVWGEPLFTLRICDWNSSVIVRFEILPWLSGPETFLGFRETGLRAWTRTTRSGDECTSHEVTVPAAANDNPMTKLMFCVPWDYSIKLKIEGRAIYRTEKMLRQSYKIFTYPGLARLV